MYKNWFCFFQMVDNFIHWMNPYVVDGPVCLVYSHLLDSDYLLVSNILPFNIWAREDFTDWYANYKAVHKLVFVVEYFEEFKKKVGLLFGV